MQRYVMNMLQCPDCGGTLDWSIEVEHEERIEEAQATCSACERTFPVHDEIGVFLPSDLMRNDLWEQVNSALLTHLAQHPEIEQELMTAPLQTLSPADQFFRATVLEERGEYALAEEMAQLAEESLYRPDYLNCRQAQRDYVIKNIARGSEPVVDIACGKGYLLEALARRTRRPLIAADFSVRILRRNQARFRAKGLDQRISFLAIDARRTPFKNRSVPIMTSYLGLANIEQPGEVLRELRRVIRRRLLAVQHFFPVDDAANAAAIEALGMGDLMYEERAQATFKASGWRIRLAEPTKCKAMPTPESVLLEGAQIDGLPVAETTLFWYTIVARGR